MLPLQSTSESEFKFKKAVCVTLTLNVLEQNKQIKHANMVTDPFTVSVIDGVFYSHVMNCVSQ